VTPANDSEALSKHRHRAFYDISSLSVRDSLTKA
jgi:hypothetical protein